MILNRAYIKIDKEINDNILKDLLYEAFETDEIELENKESCFQLMVANQDAFQMKLENLVNSCTQDLNCNISILIVPFFDDLFIKYLNFFDNQTYTAFTMFLKMINEKMVIDDCKKIIDSFDKKDIDTIKAYLSCNCNICIASNELFLHRNSMNYRINQFTYSTGIDVRDFNSMMFLNLLFNYKK